MRFAYTLLAYLLAPLLFANFLVRGFRERGYWHALLERLGFGASLEPGALWLHAVSAGEMQASAPLIANLRERLPGLRLVVTTSTPAGRARARALYPEAEIRFLPLDLPGAVQRFLVRTRPCIGVIIETELWPSLYAAARRQGLGLVIASARLSGRSARGFSRFHALTRAALAGVSVAAQTAADAERFIALGADPARVTVTGNLKFDYTPQASVARTAAEWRHVIGEARPVWVAGSTHPVEEEAVLMAHREVRKALPDALLILAPRHPPRFASVEAALVAEGLPHVVRRGPGPLPLPGNASVVLLATLGELECAYQAGDVAFVGGTLIPVGGHNLIEPAAAAKPVLFGPFHSTARVMAALLREAGGGVEVANAAALAQTLTRYLAEPAQRLATGARARAVVEANHGAASRTAEVVLARLRAARR